MLEFLAKHWWIVVVRGVAGVLFGVLTFVWPAISLAVLVLAWGAYALVDGVFALVASFTGARDGFPWWLFLSGVAGVAAGIFTFVSPAITALVLLTLIGAFSIVRGAMEIAAAIKLRKEIEHEWLIVTAGVLAVLFGVFVMIFPGAGALAIALWIGVAVGAIGVLEIIAGIRLKGQGRAMAITG